MDLAGEQGVGIVVHAGRVSVSEASYQNGGRGVSLGRNRRPRVSCRVLCGSEWGRQVILEREEVWRRIAPRAEDGEFYP